jgi:VCBS repeat-containing protein
VLQVTNPTAIGKGGHDLATGLMAVEQNTGTTDKLEVTLDNNVSWTLGGNAHIDVSFVDSSASVRVPEGVYERSEGDPGFPVTLSAKLGENDKFEGMTITAKGTGDFSVVDPQGVGGWEIVGNKLVITNFDAIGKIQVTFTPETHSDEDISFSWSAKFTNERSGDVESRSGAPYVIVDAVANAPDIVDSSVVSDGGALAAYAGQGTNVTTTLNFEDQSGREIHYGVLQQGQYIGKTDNVWLCDGALINGQPAQIITVFDQSGKPYYAVVIPHEALDANGNVDITWHVTAPNISQDMDAKLLMGGISVEPSTGTEAGHKELTLDNNWAETVRPVIVKIGAFDTTEVNFDARGNLVQNDGEGGITLHLQAPADGTNEIITEATLNFSQDGAKAGDVIGTVWHNGEAYEVVADGNGNGSVTLDFRPDGYDPAEDIRFTAMDKDGNSYHNSNPIHIESDSTVRDIHLGEERHFISSQTITMQAVADAPTEVGGSGAADAVHVGDAIIITVTATFVDLDGSEKHYVLVEAKEGWTCNDTHTMFEGPDGAMYFRIEVDSSLANVTKEVSLNAPPEHDGNDYSVNLKVGGLAQEQAAGSDNSNGFTPGGEVSLTVTNEAPELENIAGADVDRDASVSGQFVATDADENDVLTYSVEGGAADNSRAGFTHSVKGEYGTLYYNSATGAYEYVADNADGLVRGERVSESFEITVTDNHGASDSKSLGVNLTGTNNEPVLDPIISGEAEGGGAYVTGQFHATDLDGDVLTYSVDGAVDNIDPDHAGFDKVVYGEHGVLYYNSQTGEYQYEAGRGLDYSEKGSENFVVRVSDGEGGSDSAGLHIGVTGSNEAPVLDVISGIEVEEGASVSGQFSATDADGDALTYSVAGGAEDSSRDGFTHSVQGEYGTLYYNSATGAYEYVADSASKLADAPKENFTVTVTDEHGATDTQNLSVDLTGYDNPNLVLTQGATTSITEGGGVSFSMSLTSSSGNPMTASEPMTMTFLLTSTAIFDWTAAAQAGIEHEPNPGGGWLVTVTLPAGESMADISIPTIDAPGFQGDRSVTISDMEIDGGGFGGNINVYGESEFNYTVQDPTSFHLEHGATFDGSASHQGLEIYGSGANEVIGSNHGDVIHAGDGGSNIQGGAGDDTIFAGQGDDTLSGGDGNNIFAWESDKFGGSDTIVDFSFNHEWDAGGGLQAVDGMFNDKIQINFQDLLGSADDGNSLGALLQGLAGSSTGAFSYSTDQGGFTAQFSDCGKEMMITLTGSDESTLQTITVQSNTAFHDNIQNISRTRLPPFCSRSSYAAVTKP